MDNENNKKLVGIYFMGFYALETMSQCDLMYWCVYESCTIDEKKQYRLYN